MVDINIHRYSLTPREIILVFTTQVNRQPQEIILFSTNGKNSHDAKREAVLLFSEVNSTYYPNLSSQSERVESAIHLCGMYY